MKYLLVAMLFMGPSKIELPPEQFRGNATVQVEVMSPTDVGKKCRSLNREKGASACANQELMVLPDPCNRGGSYAVLFCKTLGRSNKAVLDFGGSIPNPCENLDGGSYAELVCHELGHVNGWPPNHPKK